MRRAAAFALALGACSAAQQPDAGEPGACGVCPSDRPHCDEAEGSCVECDEPDHCTGPLRACVNGSCVACVQNRDCPPEAPDCYIGTHTCRACTSDDACLFRPGLERCRVGVCAP